MTHQEALESAYNRALESITNNSVDANINDNLKKHIDFITENAEAFKGALAVLITLITHKIADPAQDIRRHQSKMVGGFSGRHIDTKIITPFLKANTFPAMAESGWLTRNFEQSLPYDRNYPYKVVSSKDKLAKEAFLTIIEEIQEKGTSAEEVLYYFFVKLIIKRDSVNIDLAKPHSLSISTIISHLEKHFTYKYKGYGASRLPVLALYAAYQCIVKEVDRYNDKILCSLANHNSADTSSGRIGDIDINNQDNTAFEGVEVKHEIKITSQMVKAAYEKFKIYNTDRYYLLTTANMDSAEWDEINAEIDKIKNIHGCQVIVNGVYSTLRYYLRLMKDTAEFIDCYVELLKVDDTIKFQQKLIWNEIVSGNV